MEEQSKKGRKRPQNQAYSKNTIYFIQGREGDFEFIKNPFKYMQNIFWISDEIARYVVSHPISFQ